MADNSHYRNKYTTPQPPEPKKEPWVMIASAAVLCVLVAVLIVAFLPKSEGQQDADDSQTQVTYQTVYADIVIKDYGTITVKLEPEHAPITVNNFVKLAESGFYDGLTFHRIMEGFMMQGGAPKTDGSGSRPDTIKGEFAANGVDNPLKHTAGAISMARTSANNSASSQFFIMHKDNSGLDGMYAVFGYVTEGMDIVDAICTESEPTDGNGSIPKDKQPVIETIIITKS